MGSSIEQLETNFVDYNLSSGRTLDYNLVARNSCKRHVRFYTILWFWVLVAILVAGLIVLGFDYMRKEFVEDDFGLGGR